MRLTLPGLGQLPRAPTARGAGATGGGLGLLHRGRGFVQYVQPSASRSPPSWSGPARGGEGSHRRRATAGRLRGNQAGTRNGRSEVRQGKERPAPGARAPARPPGPRQTSRSRARQQLSVHGADISGPAVEVPSGNRWNSADSSRLATSVRRSCQRHGYRRPARPLSTAAPQPAATSKVPTRPAIPAARSSIILASWRRTSQPSGMPLRPYSAPASCP